MDCFIKLCWARLHRRLLHWFAGTRLLRGVLPHDSILIVGSSSGGLVYIADCFTGALGLVYIVDCFIGAPSSGCSILSSSHLSSMGVDVCGSTTADFGHLPRVARVCVHASSTYVPLYRLARYELVQSEPSAAASSTGRFHVGLAARAVPGHAGWHVGSPQCNL